MGKERRHRRLEFQFSTLFRVFRGQAPSEAYRVVSCSLPNFQLGIAPDGLAYGRVFYTHRLDKYGIGIGVDHVIPIIAQVSNDRFDVEPE